MTGGQGRPCPPSLRAVIRSRQPGELTVDCPQCQAKPGRPCTGPSGRKLTNQHASRFEQAGLKPQLAPDLPEAS